MLHRNTIWWATGTTPLEKREDSVTASKSQEKKGKKIGTLVPQPITTKNMYNNWKAINRNKNTKPHTTPEANSIWTKQLRN
jgi:hypothetical protein